MSSNNLGDAYVVVTPPSAEPVTLAQAKLHLRVTIDDDDALIGEIIEGARTRAEEYSGYSIMPQTLRLDLNCFPLAGRAIEIDHGPIRSIDSVGYVDVNGDDQTWDSAEYQVQLGGRPGLLKPASGLVYPSTQIDTFAAAKVTFEAGYADAASVIKSLRRAIYFLIGHYYANTEEVIVGPRAAKMPEAATDIMDSMRDRNL